VSDKLYHIVVSSTPHHEQSCVKHHNLLLRNRSPYGPWAVFLIFADHRATDFNLSKTFESARWKSGAPFLQIIVMKKGSENDQTYMYRFVRYLSTFFYTYLPINNHFQLIIITNVSFVTSPAYFVSHLATPVVSFLRWHDFSKYIFQQIILINKCFFVHFFFWRWLSLNIFEFEHVYLRFINK
jgi:hypothetical protein